jgi:hypothetical protein
MPKWDGDGTIMLSKVPDPLVNIAHSEKFVIAVNYGGRRNACGY